MSSNYNKYTYNNHPAFELHHTAGYDAGNSTIPHPHLSDNHMLLYFLHGNGNIKIEGKFYNIQAGDLIILSSKELFHCTIDSNKYHERIGLHIGTTFLKEFSYDISSLFDVFTKRKKGTGNLISADLAESSGLSAHFNKISELMHIPGKYRDILIICKIAEILVLLNNLQGNSEYGCYNSFIDNVLDYINDNYTDNITIESVAQQFNISSSRLAHLFKEQTGLSMWNYIILRRLHHFNSLITQNISIEEACFESGFKNYSNFYRLYRKYMGISPSQFKKQKEL